MLQDMQLPIRTLRIELESTPATIATPASANHEPTHVSEGSGTSGAEESSKGSALEVGNSGLELHGERTEAEDGENAATTETTDPADTLLSDSMTIGSNQRPRASNK